MLYSIVHDPVNSANDLNHDLDLIQKWAHQWKMEFNPDPTKQATEMLFSCKRFKIHYPPLVFNGNDVMKIDPESKKAYRYHQTPFLILTIKNIESDV